MLTRRIAWRVAEGQALAPHVLALTFTRRAADELSARLAALGVRDQVAAGTFHAIAYAQLRRRWADRGERPPALLDRKTRILVPPAPARRSPSDPGPTDLAAEIEWAQARMVSPAGYAEAVAAAGRKPPLPAAAVASIYERYQQEKRRQNLVDFDDLLLQCAQALETDPAFAATQRWRFRHLFVDEFQDVNPLQFRLLEAWRDGRDDLCVVGDPRQAIYSWNGADPRYLTGFAERFPGATVVHLDENHRSSPQVVAVANAVLDGIGGRPLRAPGADGPLPTVTAYATDADEARSVVRALRRRGGAGRWSDLAVLARTHAQLVVFEDLLKAAAIPYRLRGASAFLDQPAVRGDARRPAPAPGRAAGRVASRPRRRWPSRPTEGGERGADLDVLARQAREFLALDRTGSVGGFVAWLTARLAREEPAHAGARPSTWPPSTRPRAWSGRWCSWSASSRACCPSATPPRPRPGPRSAGCSTSPSPGPSRSCTSRGPSGARSAQAPWPGRRRPGWPTSRPPSARWPAPPSPAPTAGAAAWPTAGPGCGPPPAAGGRPGPASGPIPPCSRRCGRGGPTPPGPRACRPSWSSTTPRWPRWPRPGPATGRRCWPCRAWARSRPSATATPCWPWSLAALRPGVSSPTR